MDEKKESVNGSIPNGGINENNQIKVSESVVNSLSTDIKSDISMHCNEDNGGEKLLTDRGGQSDPKKKRIKRTTFFQDRKKFARVQNYISPGSRISSRVPANFKKLISRDMTEDDMKMLDFYKKRLTSLKHDNELLHKRIVFTVNENMRLLKMKPPLKLQVTRNFSG